LLELMTVRSRIAGRVAGALVVLAALPGLAACGPPDRPLTALTVAGGAPVVLLAGCDDFTVDSLTVYTRGRNPTVAADGPNRQLDRTGSTTPQSVPLFGDPPAGWQVTDDRLTELAADQSYGLSAFSKGRNTVPIGFTAADLTALAPGEVLVGKVPSSNEKVTEKEFRKRAKKAC
jgi:hypothetical protein